MSPHGVRRGVVRHSREPVVRFHCRLGAWNTSDGAAIDTDEIRTWFSGDVGLGGVRALLSPFVLGTSDPVRRSNLVGGLVVVALFGYIVYVHSDVALRIGEPSTA